MSAETSLHRLREDLAPPAGAKKRILNSIHARMTAPAVLREASRALTPGASVRALVWARLRDRLPGRTLTLLEQIRGLLRPAPDLRRDVWALVVARLAPVQAPLWQRSYKWVAAMAVVVILLKASPLLVLAPHTVADSSVMLLPTRGEVSVSVGGLWQPVSGEIELRPGTMLRTRDGEASILFHDDGVLRLDRNTTIEVHDTTHRQEPAPDLLPSFTLHTGRVWLQGLLPPQVRGLTVATAYGFVTVHEGSVSVSEDETVQVGAWNRKAEVIHDGQESVLTAGERLELWEGNIPLIKRIPDSWYEEDWPRQNLQRDAVHRREIAQIQHERRVARAGILPTSVFYPVKRVAETVDILLTLDGESRVEKRLHQAGTRLDEAAALIADGQQADAEASLQEFQDTLATIATGSGDAVTQFLVQQSLATASADVAAALPGDASYVLKQAVLEATAGLPDTASQRVGDSMFLDQLDALLLAIEAGDAAAVEEGWAALQPSLAGLSDLPPGVRKEAVSLLGQSAMALEEHAGDADPALLASVMSYLPAEQPAQTVTLSAGEIDVIAQTVRDRIFLFHMKQSRINQFTTEVRALDGHPEQGRILRALHGLLPEGPENFPARIRREIANLRWEQAGE